MKKWLSVSLLFGTCLLHGQDLPINGWQYHLSYRDARHLTLANEQLFCATEFGLYSIDVSTNFISTWTRLDGLSDVAPVALSYVQDAEWVVVAYASGRIDLIPSEGAIRTITDLSLEESGQQVEIHSIDQVDSRLFFSTNLGIVTLDISSGDLQDNYRSIGPMGSDVNVLGTVDYNGQLFAWSDIGLLSGPLNSNLLDFNNWTYYPEVQADNWVGIGEYDGALYAVRSDSLFTWSGNQWDRTNVAYSEPILRIRSSTSGLVAVGSSGLYDALTGNLVFTGTATDLQDAIRIDNEWWLADGTFGVLRNGEEAIVPEGPINNQPGRVRVLEEDLFCFYGPSQSEYDGTTDSLGYDVFNGLRWSNERIAGFYNLTDAAKTEEGLLLTSAGFGLRLPGGEILDESNSELAVNQAFGTSTISHVVADGNGVWIGSFGSSSSLYRLQGGLPTPVTELGGLDPIDLNLTTGGTLWVAQSGRLSALRASDGATIIIGAPVGFSGTERLAGSASDVMWLSSPSGVRLYTNSTFPLENTEMQTPTFNGSPLLEFEVLNDIVVDGGNRLWVATNNGLWAFDENLSVVEQRLTFDNSPLPTNEVLQLAYRADGRLFIQTTRGLVSFRTASSSPANDLSTVRIFPNPVTPSYQGLVGISGVAAETEIKITDINGRLIRSLMSTGGTVSWDVRDIQGRSIPSGIYLVFLAAEGGDVVQVGKLAVIR